jgi:hypothetical protein
MIKRVLILAMIAGAAYGVPFRFAPLANLGAQLWTPADLNGLALWLDASDASTLWADTNATTAAMNGGRVARWDDKSGNDYFADQSTSASQPTLKGDRLRFTSHFMNHTTSKSMLRNSSSALIATVKQANETTALARAFLHRGSSVAPFQIRYQLSVTADNLHRMESRIDDDTSDEIDLRSTTTVGGVPRLHVSDLHWAGGVGSHYINSTLMDSDSWDASQNLPDTDLNTDSLHMQLIGAGRSSLGIMQQFFDGDIMEIIVARNASGAFSTSDRQKLEGYLAHKWGLTDNLPANHPYKNAPPTK